MVALGGLAQHEVPQVLSRPLERDHEVIVTEMETRTTSIFECALECMLEARNRVAPETSTLLKTEGHMGPTFECDSPELLKLLEEAQGNELVHSAPFMPCSTFSAASMAWRAC